MLKTFHNTYFERSEECLVLKRALTMYPMICLTGFEGSGKTTLIKDFLSRNQLTNFWFVLSNFLTLSGLAGRQDFTAEEAINVLFDQIQKNESEVIVWDNIHFLNHANQQKLFYRLSEAQMQKKFIFISDEKVESFGDMPIIKISGLSAGQTKEFLKFYDCDQPDEVVEEVQLKSAGLPLLIKQWILNPTANFSNEHFYKSLDVETVEMLKALSFSKINLTIAEIQVLFGKTAIEKIELLKNRYLIDINTSNEIMVLENIKKTLLVRLSEADQQKLYIKLSNVLETKTGTSEILKLIYLLGGNRWSEAAAASQKISLDDIEQLTKENLNELLTQLKKVNSTDLQRAENLYLGRIFIHVLVLLNMRSEAIEFCKNAAEELDWSQNTEIFFWFGYDIIYWLNRSKYAESVQGKISKLASLSKKPLSFLFQVELCYSQSQQNQNFTDSINSLKRIRKDIFDSKDKNSVVRLALANADYQLGILYMEIKDYSPAIEYFESAKNLFKECHRKYFELFSEFNICLNLSYLFDHSELISRLDKLRFFAKLNGYSYLMSGVCLLMAEYYFYNLQSNKALDYIEQATEKIDKGMPFHSKLAVISMKLRILKDLGLDEMVQDVFNDLNNEAGKSEVKFLKRLAIELQIEFEKIATFQEKWMEHASENNDSEFAEIYMLERGIMPTEFRRANHGKNSLRYELSVLQKNIIDSVRQDSQQAIEDKIRDFENTLRKSNEDRIERIAVMCLNLSLQKDASDAQLQKCLMYIQKISANASTKSFFKAWVESKKNKSQIQEPLEFSNIQEPEMERWMLWYPKPAKKKFTLYTNNSVTEVEDILKVIPPKGIYLIENQKELYIDGKMNAEFEKKPILIQILAILMSHGPEHLSKMSLASLLWTESYDPTFHDTRIYTSIQRIRSILGSDIIDNWKGGYRWSPRIKYYLLKSNDIQGYKQNKVMTLFIEALRNKKRNKDEVQQWMGKRDLAELAETSEATAKRVLATLLKDGLIEKKGAGTSVVYRLLK